MLLCTTAVVHEDRPTDRLTDAVRTIASGVLTYLTKPSARKNGKNLKFVRRQWHFYSFKHRLEFFLPQKIIVARWRLTSTTYTHNRVTPASLLLFRKDKEIGAFSRFSLCCALRALCVVPCDAAGFVGIPPSFFLFFPLGWILDPPCWRTRRLFWMKRCCHEKSLSFPAFLH